MISDSALDKRGGVITVVALGKRGNIIDDVDLAIINVNAVLAASD